MSGEASDDEMHEADSSSPKATENGDAVQYGELNVSDVDSVAGSREARDQQERLLEAVEERRALRETTVPTSDADVRAALRAIKEPVTLFGEQQMERRARLRKIMATMDDEDERKAALPGGAFEEEYEEAAPPKKELFYTEGSALLKQARLHIAHFSLDRAAARLAGAKRKRESPDEDEIAEQADTICLMRKVTNQSSEIADDRPSAACEFAPDGSTLATGAWSGLLKLWLVPDCQKKLTIKAHDDRVTGRPGTVQLVTGSADKTARLFSGEGKQLGSLQGHGERLGRVGFHPLGRHVGTASFDETWRLWDVESCTCLLEQEGHSRPVYTVAFHPDGSLAASGGLDAIGRVWDIRTGRSIMALQGHVQGILTMDFSPDGYHLATGSEDHSCRIWDLRKRGCVYTLPAHKSLIAQVRYDPNDGYYLLTAGFDNISKLWSSKDYSLMATLAGHEGKVMGADICPDGSGTIATISYDRTVKFWAPDTYEELEPVDAEM
ncbi:MAG: U4 U6 small nuclear ribonucleo PRP4 -like [Trebouxia sp. A1-2]|nr:MAG: U4 U6 small nuclear ribonucleo PRP4 -like [Trebouxia sp. A1-2]